MKKIVGIIAAVAMAASVFAVDFSAGFQLKGNLFTYTDGDGITALDLNTGNSKDDKPFVFSVSGDRAGGQLKLFTSEGQTSNSAVEFDAQALNIWFKPFDAVRIDLGNTDLGLNVEHVTWWRGKTYGSDDWGFKATFNKDALEVALFLSANNTPWFKNTVSLTADNAYKAAYDAALAGITNPTEAQIEAAKTAGNNAKTAALAAGEKTTALAELALKASYNADFGNIAVIFDAKDKFKTLAFGAGYSGSFGSSSIFADFVFEKGASTNGIKFDVDYQISVDAIAVELYTGVWATDISNFSDTMAIPLFIKASYALNGGSLYAKFMSGKVNKMDVNDPFKGQSHNVEVGYDGNLGAISYEVAANYNITTKGFSVPFWVRLSF